MAPRRALTPEEGVAVQNYYTDLATNEARARAAESKVHVLMSKASENDAYQKDADSAMQELSDIQSELDDMRSNPPNFEDKSGTRAGLSDSIGNFARNAQVANAGGIGVEGSNSTEDGDQADDPEDAGIEMDLGPTVAFGRGGRAETMAGQRVAVHPDDEKDEEDEEATTTSPRTRRRRKAAAKRGANKSTRRSSASPDSEEE